jgi:hypothetical protein
MFPDTGGVFSWGVYAWEGHGPALWFEDERGKSCLGIRLEIQTNEHAIRNSSSQDAENMYSKGRPTTIGVCI